jgi:hypothetical protein
MTRTYKLLVVFVFLVQACADRPTPDPGNVSALSTGPCVAGDSWITIDDFQYVPGRPSQAGDFTSDTNGILYAAGEGTDSNGLYHWLVRKSLNSGRTWLTEDDFIYGNSYNAGASGIVANYSNIVFVAGYGIDSTSTSHWIVRTGNNTSPTWTTADDYIYPGATDTKAEFIAMDIFNDIFVAGTAAGHSLVRESSDGGNTWTNIDDDYPGAGVLVTPNAISLDTLENVYVTGTIGSNPSAWLTRQAVFSGGTWTWSNVDNFIFQGTNNSSASTLASDLLGNVYVIGQGDGTVGVSNWITRKSSDQGATWASVDQYQYTSGYNATGSGIVTDPTGDVYATGNVQDNQFDDHIVVRESVDGGNTWALMDDFVYSDYGAPNPLIRTDSSGKEYTVFTFPDAQNIFHWLVRTCQ